MGRVIALANQKGGVAKTTSTLNLAVAFAEEGHKVLAIDLDPQGNLTMSQGLNPDTIERSMYDVLVHRLPIEQIIHQGEIDLAVASIDLAGAELALSAMIGRERSLEKALQPVLGDVRLRRHRHAAVARPADDQRAGRRERRDRARSVRVPVPARSGPAREHPEHDPREPQPSRRDRGDPARRCTTAGRSTRARRSRSSRRTSVTSSSRPGSARPIRYAEAPVKGTSVLKYDPTGTAAQAYRDLAKEVLNGAQARKHA